MFGKNKKQIKNNTETTQNEPSLERQMLDKLTEIAFYLSNEKCLRCNGTGLVTQYGANGQCPSCKGTKYVSKF